MKLEFKQKITDKEIDLLVSRIYKNHLSNPNDKYHFDFTTVEYIGNQELLILSALLKTFVDLNIQFEVNFFNKGVSSKEISERVKKQIIQFWDVWKIWKILPFAEYDKYFGVDSNFVERLKNDLNYYPKMPEIYTRYGITPFISLAYINNYNEVEIQKIVSPIYNLNLVIEQLLHDNKCYHPFTSNSLSTIITEELYLNFLDHSGESSFGNSNSLAFMSISLQAKLLESRYTYDEIQRIKKLNFKSECLENYHDFFYDNSKNEYKNFPFIQFSFLDFGKGIPNTLRDRFLSNFPEQISHNDSDILKYAFNHNSSRHSIDDIIIDRLIPRGLFDTLIIAQRYKGLLVVRSGFGKILFNFSKSDNIDEAFSSFGDNKTYFPGTLISLYIPAINKPSETNIASIKPNIVFTRVKSNNVKYKSITSIVDKIGLRKETLYSELLRSLKSEVCYSEECSLTFLNFINSNIIEKRIVKKILYFLLSDYDINLKNNIIVVDLPSEIIDEIEYELLQVNIAIKNYKIHPLPIINLTKDVEEVKVRWLGVYDEGDRRKLDNLLFEDYTAAKSDFVDPSNLIGHLIDFDNFGNLQTNFPNITKLKLLFEQNEINRLLTKHNCIKVDNGEELYLCNGNYYQKEYIELSNLFNDKVDCSIVSKFLFEKIHSNIERDISDFQYIGITTPSQKILKSLIEQELIRKEDCILLDSYQTFDRELSNLKEIDISKKYVLVCDAISTGYLSQRLTHALNYRGVSLDYIAVIVNVLDEEFSKTKLFLESFEGHILSLYQYRIKKFNKNEIFGEIKKCKIIRINPHTNLPIKLSINETKYNETIIYKTEVSYNLANNEITIDNKFIDEVKEEHINIGFLLFNNLIHPYFFDTKEILKNLDELVLIDVFRKINISNIGKEHVQIFFPRKSGIENLNFASLKNSVIGNQLIEVLDMERYVTNEGWRFPHNPEYLINKINENTICLVLDDGSCSGDSIIQMIDEISFYRNKKIVLVCFIGRIHDHKREFFSRISMLKNKDSHAEISIYFVTHWHIPTFYLDDNPTTKEIEWLNNIINLQNTPQSIKNVAQSILSEISPKREYNFTDYKYLPRNRVTNSIPKKDILLIREELGKVIGYRMYKESFVFFDCFFKKYENKKQTVNRYKEIELLCATFIYEPYLYDKITTILPDIVEQLEEFVRILIFSDQKIYDMLTYSWEKKDIIHLFFIVFKNEKLVNELTIENFTTLIAFTQPKESALNYVLYKLLYYFPLKAANFTDSLHDETFKNILSEICDKNIDVKTLDEIKKYNNFIRTLPNRDDFKSQINLLRENFQKQKESENHDKKISFNHNVSLILSKIRICVSNIEEGKDINDENTAVIRECWFEMLDYLTPILSFCSRFIEFIQPYPYYKLTKKIEDMRREVGFNEEVIFTLKETFNDTNRLKLLERNILKIQLDFGDESDFFNLINYPYSNLNELLNGLYNEILLLPNTYIKKDILIEIPYNVSIPKMYADKLIINEITTNIKNHAKTGDDSIIIIQTDFDGKVVTVEIQNEMNDESGNGSGEGIKCLRMLSNSSLFGFEYSSTISDKTYFQKLKFLINM